MIVVVIIVFLLLPLNPAQSSTPYDATAYTQCKATPANLLYAGGIVTNPDFDDGLTGWLPFGSCNLEWRTVDELSDDDNDADDDDDDYCATDPINFSNKYFLVATNRTSSFDGPSQILSNLTAGTKYIISAWLQVSGPPATVPVNIKATIAMNNGKDSIGVGLVLAQSGCWSFLKGGFVLDYTPATSRLYFETFNYSPGLEIWVDRVSVQPFRHQEWSAHQRRSTEMIRKRMVKLQVIDSRKRRVHDAKIEVVGAELGFPFGSALSHNILSYQHYQSWFLERFNSAVFENEMKWYTTEPQRGHVNYSTCDKMVAFCERHDISLRGHNIVWNDPQFQQQWVKALASQPSELRAALVERVQSLVKRYIGQVVGWDVSNEQLHFRFYEDALKDANVSTMLFTMVQRLDPKATLFINDYYTLEQCNDAAVSADAYAATVGSLQAAGIKNLGVGLQSHFSKPNIPYMRATLDKLATLGLPIWITELDINVASVRNITQAAVYLKEVLQEAYSHPAVAGVVLWAAWHPSGCYRMCLTDANMNNLPTGDVLDSLLSEWRRVDVNGNASAGNSNSAGSIKWRGPIGYHNIAVHWKNSSFTTSLRVVPGRGVQRFFVELTSEGLRARDRFQQVPLSRFGSESIMNNHES